MAHDLRLEEARTLYARMMAAASGVYDPRLERVFEMVPREAFLPPGPWHIKVGHGVVETPSADPVHLYQNVLVALDAEKGINNGEPFLHASWIGAVAPQPGETVVQVGAGGGYYTAILSVLVLPDGKVFAYELDRRLADQARHNLEPFENVSVIHGDAVEAELPAADVVYVNAGVVAPPASWLEALAPGGRIVFPWRPTEEIGLAVLARREASGFSARVLGGAWFIPCAGASDRSATLRKPDARAARKIGAIHLRAEREPDESAVAVYPDVWFAANPP